MMIFTDRELAEGCQGSLKISGIKGSISTDTRTIKEGVWFVALVGDRFDAHDFLDQKLERKDVQGLLPSMYRRIGTEDL